MQENEFEKQVKEMMESFHVIPSEPVWNKIKKQLKEKRRRAWPFMFLLFAVALISGGLLYFNTKKDNQSKHETVVLNNKKKKINSVSIYKINNQKLDLKDSINSKKKIVLANNPQTLNTQVIHSTPVKKQYKNFNAENFVFENNSNKKRVDAIQNEYSIFNKKIENKYVEHEMKTINTEKNIQPDPASALHHQANSDSLKATAASTKNPDKNVLVRVDSLNKIITQTSNDSSQTKKKSFTQKSKSNKLFFGITAFVGRSNISNNFLSLNTDKSLLTNDVLNNPGNSAGGIPITSNNLPSRLYSSSGSFGLGFTVNKPVAKHSYFSSGLNYLYLSATTKTGGRIDSSVSIQPSNQFFFSLNNYYRNGDQNFTNSFHLIELPVYFKQDFIHSKKINISYNAGFSVMQLIAAHVLIYDAAKNVFYSQNSVLNHTQFQLAGGLNFQFNLKNKNAVSIGPHVGYSLSNFSKNINTKKLHYSNYGLQLNWMFRK